jgi:D-proline reductase (dithiol) PrdB
LNIMDNRDQWEAEFRAGWLAPWPHTGTVDWEKYNYPLNKLLPPTPGVDLSASRLLLISTSGAYLRTSQEPFDASNILGDYTIRTFSSSAPFSTLAFAHNHFDHTAVNADPQVILPLEHLADLVAEGVIGEMAPEAISFMGYQPDLTRVVDELIPPILTAAKELQVQAALLVPV